MSDAVPYTREELDALEARVNAVQWIGQQDAFRLLETARAGLADSERLARQVARDTVAAVARERFNSVMSTREEINGFIDAAIDASRAGRETSAGDSR